MKRFSRCSENIKLVSNLSIIKKRGEFYNPGLFYHWLIIIVTKLYVEHRQLMYMATGINGN